MGEGPSNEVPAHPKVHQLRLPLKQGSALSIHGNGEIWRRCGEKILHGGKTVRNEDCLPPRPQTGEPSLVILHYCLLLVTLSSLAGGDRVPS